MGMGCGLDSSYNHYSYTKEPSAWDSGLLTTNPRIYLQGEVGEILSSIQGQVGNDEFSVFHVCHSVDECCG